MSEPTVTTSLEKEIRLAKKLISEHKALKQSPNPEDMQVSFTYLIAKYLNKYATEVRAESNIKAELFRKLLAKMIRFCEDVGDGYLEHSDDNEKLMFAEAKQYAGLIVYDERELHQAEVVTEAINEIRAKERARWEGAVKQTLVAIGRLNLCEGRIDADRREEINAARNALLEVKDSK